EFAEQSFDVAAVDFRQSLRAELRLDVPLEHIAIARERARPDLADELRQPLLGIKLHRDLPVADQRGGLARLFDLVGQDVVGLLTGLARHPASRAGAVAIVHHVLAATLPDARHDLCPPPLRYPTC